MITSKQIPSIVGSQLSEVARSLVSLPVRLGGMGIESPSSIASDKYSRSKQMTGPLAAIIALQGISLPDVKDVDQIRKETLLQKSDALKQKSDLIDQSLSPCVLRNLQQAREQGASSWASALPLKKYGFALNKEEFRDVFALRYNRHISNLPSICACGDRFNTTHVMDCKKGGFVYARHDSIRDFKTTKHPFFAKCSQMLNLNPIFCP